MFTTKNQRSEKMPQGVTSDDYYKDVMDTFNLVENPVFAEQIIEEAKGEENSELWGMIREGDYEAVLGHMYLNGYDIPNDLYNEYIKEDVDEYLDEQAEQPDEFIPDKPYDIDQAFNTGAEFAGSLQIVESENEKVYIPSSYYCHTKVFNKFLELQGREPIIPLEGSGVNPYAMSMTSFLNHIMKYIFKCDCVNVNGDKRCTTKCVTEKRKKFNDKKTGNDFYRDNSTTEPYDKTNPDNYKRLSICRVWWDGEKVQVVPINKAKQFHPKMCIGLVMLNGTENCHAILIKDYNNLSKDDIVINLTKDKELYPGFKKFKQYTYRDPKPYAVSWDIEAWVHPILNRCTKCRMTEKLEKEGKVSRSKKECTCKYSYKLNVSAIGYEILNVIERTIIQPCQIVFDPTIKEDDETTLFDKFFVQLHNDCKKLGIKDVNLYAHNGGKFDNIFAKKSKVVKFDSEISNGNHIKSMKLLIDIDDYKLKLCLLDTLPFTLQPLKDACATFKTEVCKEEFDIVNKSRKWYCMNNSREMHEKVMKSKKLKDDYMYHYLDMHMKCNYNVPVTNKGNGNFSCSSKFAEKGREAKMKELEDIKTFKDWRRYLTFDVRSLSFLIFNVDIMYNDFGFSITNYVGLPGIAMDMMNSYCYNLSKLYVPSDPSVVELCKASIKGGRVIHFKDIWDSPIDEYGNYKDYLICIDMNSLYPSAMFACGFPVGKPELVPKSELESGDWVNYPHYLGEFEITIPNIRYAIHPYKTEKGTLTYPSNQTVIDVYNDVDVREMIKDGYTVKMRKGIYWKKSSKIFSELVNMIFNKRNEYKSKNPDDADYNKEYICKILLNSMFGKFNETIKSLVRFFSGDEEEVKKIINKKCRLTRMANMQYRINETLKVPRISKPTYIAGYITAYSRAICNEIFRKVGPENVAYSDTDSLYIKHSDFIKSGLNCSNGLCGFKNDYGDGVMITKARFLDIKRCYFEFRVKVDSECFDKWGQHRLSCKDPITKEVNKGEPYYVKTFKFKYTGVNFKDIVTSSALEPDNKLYSTSKSKEEYNKIMENTSKIVDKFIENNKNNQNKKFKEYDNIKFIMKRFKKTGQDVTINLGEFAFCVTKEKRGQWISPCEKVCKCGKRKLICESQPPEYYALGFDQLKPEVKLYQNGEIGDLVNKFANYTKCNYGFFIEDDRKYLRSRRPLFYNIRMHIELIKEYADKYPRTLRSNNEYILEHNKANPKSVYIQNIFNKFLEYMEDVKSGKIKPDNNTTGKYTTFLKTMQDTYIPNEKIKQVNHLINNDVVYDNTKKFETDYYIEFLSDEIPATIKYDDYNKKYRIISRLSKYGKNGKESEYFIPNFINVKCRTEVNHDKLYPVIMLSTRFNKDLGNNNLENWQAMIIIKNII